MFADDKKKAGVKIKGDIKPKNIVASDAPSTLGSEQITGMVGGIGDAIGGTAGKRINQAADLANKALDAKAKVLAGGVTPNNIVASGSAPALGSEQITGMVGGIGDAIGGTAGKRINQAADLINKALDAKAKVLAGGVPPMNLAAGEEASSMVSSAMSAVMGGAQPSGLQFTLTAAGLSPQTFVVVDFSLNEMFSSPFVLNVGLASADPAVDFAAVLDEDATLFIWREGILQRSITGMVASFEQGNTGFHQTRYSMVIRPALWRTSLRRNSRIFQQESIETIITTLLKENGINDFAFGLRNSHPAREFCVQYQESDFDFIQRLTAEEGIFYYFEFSAGKNTVVYADDVGSLPKGAVLPYNPNVAAQAQELCVTTFTRSAQVRPAVVQLKDYTFKNPNWKAEFSQQAGELQNQRADYEHFDFPGRFKDEQHGQDFTRYRLEALRNDANLGQGQSNDFTLQPGQLFTLTNHPRGDLNHPWQLLGIQHNGQQPQALEHESGGQGTFLTNQFSFIPHTQTWRPTPLPKPVMDGPQIAMVVGPPGEEIYCDEFGRVRLQFLWDRYGKNNDNSSCWIRVTQPWAGQGWGMVAIPRIGQEVVVDFLHGDPDQPIVTGRTYHANNLPSIGLPAAKTQMAFRSKTHKGEGYNELRFEDAKGGEGLFMHAQKDMTTMVKNDQSLTVEGGNRTLSILAGNETKTVKQGGLSENICTMRSTSANQVQVKAKAGKSGPGTQLYEASDDITLKVGAGEIKMTTSSIKITFGGSCIQLDTGGVYIDGAVIHLNKNSVEGTATTLTGEGADVIAGIVPEQGDVKYDGYKSNNKELLFAVKHPVIAKNIGTIERGKNNISTVAHRFASTGNGDNALQYTQPNGSTEGTEVNAFRHTVWQAGITSKYSADIAKEVGDAHEINPNAFMDSNRIFDTMADADQVTDLLNNRIGRDIGGGNSGKNMKELSSSVLDEFYQNGLYSVKENADGKYIVEKTTLAKEKYEYLKEHYGSLDENGNLK